MTDPFLAFLKCYEQMDREDKPFRFFVVAYLTESLRNQLPPFVRDKQQNMITFVLDKRIEPMLMINESKMSMRLSFSGVSTYLEIPLDTIHQVQDEFNQYVFINVKAELQKDKKGSTKKRNHLRVVK